MLGLIERRESRTRQKHLQVSPLVTFPFLNPLRGIHDYLKEKKKKKKVQRRSIFREGRNNVC